MQTIKITPTFRATLDAIINAGKTPWVIINEDYVVDAFEGRAKARAAKAAGLAGKIVAASDVKFKVVDLAAQATPAPVENKTAFPVFPALAAFIAEPSAPVAAPVVDAPKPKAPKIPLTQESTIEHPCKRVWYIADEMKDAAGGLDKIRRKDVLARCVAEGIAYYTARTQYQLWLTIQNGGSI